ncbi:PREDICTED: berberine bridge enzyme-like 4 [Nelumbo nucifera]|uniref:Berberine bridge enzyme-like 4 n=1 Tax=Nelumbo nucifera TaxID=4432 RepID=A0A1U8AHS1_NELNU|nr:PREDICTED: berberine bridge enzyme-like 4 [Nelumbo nucifera]
MGSSSTSAILSLFFILVLVPWATSASVEERFLQCLSLHSDPSSPISAVVYSPNNSSYLSIYTSTITSLRFLQSSARKPLFIITPSTESHVQTAVICAKENGLEIRIRGGGHDYEALSSMAEVPFVIVDMSNLKTITVDIEDNSAWVQAGATLGELYYRIAEKSNVHGFPGGVCHTVGVSGFLGGGGYGYMLRKYGLGADQVIDAQMVDANGKILNRETMGEDLFWAIRGGGAASFGIILRWKVRLVPVPPVVTVFNPSKTIEEGATKLVHRWQYVAHKLHEDIFMRINLALTSTSSGGKTVNVEFSSMFLGTIDRLLPLMNESFPELGLKREDCTEMSWIDAMKYLGGFPDSTLEVLLNRTLQSKSLSKNKSDYVKKPIPESAFEGIWKRFLQMEIPVMQLNPYGGRMSEISESATPFPHRKGNIYKIQYIIIWQQNGTQEIKRHINWVRELYKYMTPYVSKSPREAYLNYRDLDIGKNNKGNTSYSQASIWGRKYFKNNFDRLVYVKSKVDPGNFFRNEQSIPAVTAW